MSIRRLQLMFRKWAIGRTVAYKGQQCRVAGVDDNLRLLLEVPGLDVLVSVSQLDVDFGYQQ